MRQEFGVEPCLTQMAVAHDLVKKVERDYNEIALDAEFQGASAGLFSTLMPHEASDEV